MESIVEITSENSPLKVDFIPNIKGIIDDKLLGLTHAPGKKEPPLGGESSNRDIALDLEALKATYNTKVIVTLNEEKEFIQLQIPDLLIRIVGYEMESIFYPIKDMNIPQDSMEKFTVFVDKLISRVKEGKTVVIHCKAGKGRTGLVVACCLVRLGMQPQKAIKTVRDTRQGTIQTWMQEKFISNFAKHIGSM